jgi:mannose-1-phosphate guanylyltransferase
MTQSRYVVIMAGGIGSRFWPVSRTDYPKQFLDILGIGQTMIQQTYKRFEKFIHRENIYVVTSDEYVSIVEAQLPSIPKENIAGEPLRRNTAPCIAYICCKIMQKDPDASIIVTPSDHLILNPAVFLDACETGLHFVQNNHSLVTLGVKPAYPSTGYGYIQKAESETEPSVYHVSRFIEKPYLELARIFVKSDGYLWNSGVFIWKASDIMEAFKKYLPEMYSLFDHIKDTFHTDEEKYYLREVYEQCENISIDFGILEKSDNVYIIPASFEWSDLGTWSSAWDSMQKDYMYNAIPGRNVMAIDTKKCIVHSSPDKLVVVQGLSDYIVADTSDVLLICQKEKEQEIKTYLTEIKKNTGDQYLYTRK